MRGASHAKAPPVVIDGTLVPSLVVTLLRDPVMRDFADYVCQGHWRGSAPRDVVDHAGRVYDGFLKVRDFYDGINSGARPEDGLQCWYGNTVAFAAGQEFFRRPPAFLAVVLNPSADDNEAITE